MQIAILVLSASKYFGQKGSYHLQEVGLAKELSYRNHHVSIYKCVRNSRDVAQEDVCKNVRMYYIPVKTIGQHSLLNPSMLNCDIDILVCFSDNQISTPKVYRWAKKNQIVFIPYIGCLESTSPNLLKCLFMNILFDISCRIYRNSPFLAKTNYIYDILEKKGMDYIEVAPVGLNLDLMNKRYKEVDKQFIKKKWGYRDDEKIILMIGRLETDRNPMDCIPVFKKIYHTDPSYRFLIIGDGNLKDKLKDGLEKIGLLNVTDFFRYVPNRKMWEAYCICDCMVSFSHTEIFGMSILEAMYYEKTVFALHAPGPNDIIKDSETGYLFDTPEQMAEIFFDKSIVGIGENAHKSIIEHFTWKVTADKIEKIMNF